MRVRKLSIFLCPLSAQIASTAYAVSLPSLPPILPCARLAILTWASPADVRTCMYDLPFRESKRKNILDVITKTLAFHASTNYQIHAPQPFDKEIEWDLLTNLEQMRTKSYGSDFDFHQDVRQSIMQVKDGHLKYTNGCYDNVYTTYNPFPLVLLTNESDGSQAIHIAPRAHEIANAVFGNEVKFWEKHLPAGMSLQNFSGARVIQINERDPFAAVDDNANVTGVFQGLSSRQNSFFSTAVLRDGGWDYRLGDFAEHTLPLVDSVDLTVQRVGTNFREKITVPYRSKYIGKKNRVERLAYELAFCRPSKDTNGNALSQKGFQEAEGRAIEVKETLPKPLQPCLEPLEGSGGRIQFCALDRTTGVLAMGDFGGSGDNKKSADATSRLKQGLQNMNETGIDKLIIDLTNNAGGLICVAHFLHRILLGRTNKTCPQPGLDTTLRMPEIAQEIIKKTQRSSRHNIYKHTWYDATHKEIKDPYWYRPITNITINGHQDFFSKRLGVECPMPELCVGEETLNPQPLFRPENIILLSDGRCGSACAVFSVLLAKKHNVTTVVVGGKMGVPQQYCGFVGGQTVSFRDIDTALKTTKLKIEGETEDDTQMRVPHIAAEIPPDFTVNGGLKVTWRLAYGVDDKNKPEEWQDHTASNSLPLTAKMAHNPREIWEAAARKFFSGKLQPQPEQLPLLQVQLP